MVDRWVVVPAADSVAFFFNGAATTEIYTLSLHDALPIFADVTRTVAWTSSSVANLTVDASGLAATIAAGTSVVTADRKSTRLNSSHVEISYAVFCLKKKKRYTNTPPTPISNTLTHRTRPP